MKTRLFSFTTFLLLFTSKCWAIEGFPYSWETEIQYIQEHVFPAIPSKNLPVCNFVRRQWTPLKTSRSVDVYNEKEFTNAISNNNSITINLKADILLYGNTSTTHKKTGETESLITINGNKTIIINGQNHKIFDFSNPVKGKKLRGNKYNVPFSKELNGNETFIDKSGQIIQYARSKMYRAKGWNVSRASEYIYGLVLPDELRNLNISSKDNVWINFRVSFVRQTYKVVSCLNGVIYFIVDKKDSYTTQEYMRNLSPQTDFYLTNLEENDEGFTIKNGILSYPSKYEEISQCEASYIFHTKGQAKIEFNEISIIGGMEYGIMNSASIRIHHSYMTNSIFGGIYNTGLFFADHNHFDNFKTNVTRTEHYPYQINNHNPNMEVVNNVFSNIGIYSTNVHAVWSDATAYIAYNEFINTNYSAIRIGKLNCKETKYQSNNLVEHNLIHHTTDWIEKRKQLGFQDSGDIYISPNNGKATIRYNTILNCGGLGKNNAIYGDDGAYNMDIYCNIILDTENYYDIDCRDGSKKGEPRWTIPKECHLSTNNFIAYNVCNGYLRMQENQNDRIKKTGCSYVNNYVINKGNIKRNRIENLVNLKKTKDRNKAIIQVGSASNIIPLVLK